MRLDKLQSPHSPHHLDAARGSFITAVYADTLSLFTWDPGYRHPQQGHLHLRARPVLQGAVTSPHPLCPWHSVLSVRCAESSPSWSQHTVLCELCAHFIPRLSVSANSGFLDCVLFSPLIYLCLCLTIPDGSSSDGSLHLQPGAGSPESGEVVHEQPRTTLSPCRGRGPYCRPQHCQVTAGSRLRLHGRETPGRPGPSPQDSFNLLR